jgi:hypothetical protein
MMKLVCKGRKLRTSRKIAIPMLKPVKEATIRRAANDFLLDR